MGIDKYTIPKKKRKVDFASESSEEGSSIKTVLKSSNDGVYLKNARGQYLQNVRIQD